MFLKDWHNDNKIRNKSTPHSFHNKPAAMAASDYSSYNTSHKSSSVSCFITILSMVAMTQHPIFSQPLLNADGKAVSYKHFPIIYLSLDKTHTDEHLKVQHLLQDLKRVPIERSLCRAQWIWNTDSSAPCRISQIYLPKELGSPQIDKVYIFLQGPSSAQTLVEGHIKKKPSTI